MARHRVPIAVWASNTSTPSLAWGHATPVHRASGSSRVALEDVSVAQAYEAAVTIASPSCTSSRGPSTLTEFVKRYTLLEGGQGPDAHNSG